MIRRQLHAKIGTRVRLLYDMGPGTMGRTGVVTCNDGVRTSGYATVLLDGNLRPSYSLYLLRAEYVELSPLELLAMEAE